MDRWTTGRNTSQLPMPVDLGTPLILFERILKVIFSPVGVAYTPTGCFQIARRVGAAS